MPVTREQQLKTAAIHQEQAATIRDLRSKGLTWQQVQAHFQGTIGYGFSIYYLQQILKKDDARIARETKKAEAKSGREPSE